MDIADKEFLDLAAGSTSRFHLWQRIIETLHVEIMAEIGVWKGDFSRYILERCDSLNLYYMIDPWVHIQNWNKPLNVTDAEFLNVYETAMTETDFAASKRVVLRGRTSEMVEQIPDNSLDLAYIDGDHTLRGITIDLIKLFPKIREGGLIGGDDFTNTPWQHDTCFEPTLVCPFSIYFSEAMDLPIVAFPFNQFVIQKRSGGTFSFVDITGTYTELSLRKLHFDPLKSNIKNRLKRILGLGGPAN